eukprot:TRINITY_DN1186_c0_g1_i3.p1 TRINITY_DN1186_c0_g1~~TRINITY_DN1186_c0_g1_i3.p1  ORF type:complete len:884 (+),score=163.24 TRINITY_DN1186_c0_g1_i3:258-2909(+)
MEDLSSVSPSQTSPIASSPPPITRPKRASEGNMLHRFATENNARSAQTGAAPRGRVMSASGSMVPHSQTSSTQPLSYQQQQQHGSVKRSISAPNYTPGNQYYTHQESAQKQTLRASIFSFVGYGRDHTLPVSAQGPDEPLDGAAEDDLHSFGLRFADCTLENSYEEYFWERFYLELRSFWGWGIVLVLVYTGVFLAVNTSMVGWTVGLYGLAVLVPMGFVYKFGGNQYMSHRSCMLSYSIALVMSITGGILGISLAHWGSVETSIPYGAMIFIVGCVVPNMRIPFIFTLGINSAIYVIYVGALLLSDDSFTDARHSVLQLFILFFCCCLNIRLARMWEYHLRSEFLKSRRIGGENERLRKQVWELERNSQMIPTNEIDMESPIEKAVCILKEVISRVGEDEAQNLSQVLKVITQHQDMLMPNFTAQFESGKTIDEDVGNWLFYELASREKKPLSRQNSMGDTRRSTTVSIRRLSALSILPTITPEEEKLLEEMLAKQIPWNWDVFEIDKMTTGRPLYFVVMYLFKKYDFYSRFKLDEFKLQNFITAVEKGYNTKVPYHNNIHAADVVLSLHHLFSVGKLSKCISELDLLAGILAAAVHDYGHPGFNNAFQINSMSKKALIYNDKSVLENYHISTTWMLLKEPQNDFLFMLSEKEKKDIRSMMIDMVLATDMAYHFETLADMKTRLAAGEFDFEDARNKTLMMKVALKVADVGHVAKKEDLHEKWTNLIQSEFYLQGDREKSSGLPVSPFMDRETSSIPKSQIGFINFVVLPLFEAFNFTGDHTALVQQIKRNQVLWEARLKLEPLTPRVNGSAVTLPSLSMAQQVLPPIPQRQDSRSEMDRVDPLEKEFDSIIETNEHSVQLGTPRPVVRPPQVLVAGPNSSA